MTKFASAGITTGSGNVTWKIPDPALEQYWAVIKFGQVDARSSRAPPSLSNQTWTVAGRLVPSFARQKTQLRESSARLMALASRDWRRCSRWDSTASTSNTTSGVQRVGCSQGVDEVRHRCNPRSQCPHKDRSRWCRRCGDAVVAFALEEAHREPSSFKATPAQMA